MTDESFDTTLTDAHFEPEQIIEVQPVRNAPRSTRNPNPKYTCFASTVEVEDPIDFDDAISRSDSNLWCKAMQEEFDSLTKNETWTLTELPANRRPIDCRWVFKTKRDSNGKIVRHKARLVIKGCAQRRGIDYDETYAPVVRYTSIRFLLALATKLNHHIEQMDAVCAFLQGELEEEIFMLQRKGFSNNSKKVCRLKKSLYGLKQASKIWNSKLNSVLISFGLKRSNHDPCVYHNVTGNDIIIVAVYVDDLLVFSTQKNESNKLKTKLSSSFEMKDIGDVSSVLGMNIIRNYYFSLLFYIIFFFFYFVIFLFVLLCFCFVSCVSLDVFFCYFLK